MAETRRYHLVSSSHTSGGFSEFSATTDAEAIDEATRHGGRIVALSEVTWSDGAPSHRRVALGSPEPLQPHEARIVLDVAGEGFQRYASGSMRALCTAAMLLDRTNLALLGLGFPALAQAVAVYKNQPNGLVLLRQAADR